MSTPGKRTTTSTTVTGARPQQVTYDYSDTGSSPTEIVHNTTYVWNDDVTATATSATGTYLIDLPSFTDTEDASGNQYECTYTGYDGQAPTSGQTSSLTLGEPTVVDDYTSCGSTPTGLISTTTAYDSYGNPIGADDADAVAGETSHLGCSVASTLYSSCITYDSTYDELPTSTANALDQSTTTTYGFGFGLWPSSTTDPNDQTTSYTYDPLGRETSETLPGETSGLTTDATTYTDWCSGTSAQAPCVEIDDTQRLNNTTTVTSRSFYDGLGHLVETRTPAPGGEDSVQYWYYDENQRVAFESVPYLVTAYTGSPGAAAYSVPDSTEPGTSYTYDSYGRVLSTTDPLSDTTTNTYSVVCNPISSISGCYLQTMTVDPNDHESATLTDALGREAYVQSYTGDSSSTYALYSTTTYTYDEAGNLIQILAPDGQTRTTYTYDTAGRETGMSDPDKGTESYTYDQDGNLIKSVDARGAAGTVYLGYDGIDRLTWENTSDSPTGAFLTYSYDSTTGGNDGVGRLTGETFSGAPINSLSGSESYAYDDRGQQTGTTLTIGSNSYPVATTYDDAGDILSQQYPDGETVTNAYGSQGWLSGVSTKQGSTTTTLLSSAAYSGVGGAFGEMTSASIGGGVYAYSANYDLLDRAVNLELTRTSDDAVLFEEQQTFDPAGNVTSIDTKLPQGTDNQSFCYDEQNRLTWAGSSGTPPCTGTQISSGTLSSAEYSQSFSYDAMGRMTSGSAGTYTYGDTSHVHAATSIGSSWSASYDAAGNMTCRATAPETSCSGSSPNGAVLQWGPDGELDAWQNSPQSPTSTEQYLYDGQGNLVEKESDVSGTSTNTIYVGELEEIVSSGSTTTTTAYYYADGSRFAMSVNGTFYYLATDAQGTPEVAVDASGNPVASVLYSPYGGVRYQNGTMPTDYGYTGQRADSVSGLDYYGARFYDPVAAQFVSADDILPGGGFDPLGLSRYAYAEGNPTTLVDPTGNFSIGGLISHVASAVKSAARTVARVVSHVASAISSAAHAVATAARPVTSAVGNAISEATHYAVSTARTAVTTARAISETVTSHYSPPSARTTSHPAAPSKPRAVINVQPPSPSGLERIPLEEGPGGIILDPIGSDLGLGSELFPPAPDISPSLGNLLAKDKGPGLPDPGSIVPGATPQDVINLLPPNIREAGQPARAGGGTRYPDPDRPGDQLIIEPGYPGASGIHGGPYVKISIGGNVVRIPLAGNPTL